MAVAHQKDKILTKLDSGGMAEVWKGKTDGKIVEKIFRTDMHLHGTIAFYTTFDEGLSADLITSGYRFKQAKIEKVENE